MKKFVIAIFCALTFSTGLHAAGNPVSAPDFSLGRVDGGTVKLSALLPKGYVVLNFWARWCESCKEEIPELARLMKSPGAEKVSFIGVEVGSKADKVSKFVNKFKYPYAVALDQDEAVSKKYGILGLPVTLIIDKKGKIVYRDSRPPKTFDFTK